MLEWSSLYRVTLLLSKINDDSDLDAEAAILYGKVSTAIVMVGVVFIISKPVIY